MKVPHSFAAYILFFETFDLCRGAALAVSLFTFSKGTRFQMFHIQTTNHCGFGSSQFVGFG